MTSPSAVRANDVDKRDQSRLKQGMKTGERADADAQLLDRDAGVSVGIDMNDSSFAERIGEESGDGREGRMLCAKRKPYALKLIGEGELRRDCGRRHAS